MNRATSTLSMIPLTLAAASCERQQLRSEPIAPAAPLRTSAPKAQHTPWVWIIWPSIAAAARRQELHLPSSRVVAPSARRDALVMHQGQEMVWSTPLEPALGPRERLFLVDEALHDGSLVVMARYAPGSHRASVMAVQLKSGAIAWRHPLEVPLPEGIVTGAHATELQIHANEGQWWIFAKAHAGHFAWRLDPMRGQMGPRQRAAALHASWHSAPQKGPAAAPLSVSLRPPAGLHIARHPGRWARTVALHSAQRQGIDTDLNEDAAVVVAFGLRTGGGQLIALDADNGVERWSKRLLASPLPRRDGVSQTMTLELDDAGRVLLWRETSSDKTFEAFAVESGQRLIHMEHP